MEQELSSSPTALIICICNVMASMKSLTLQFFKVYPSEMRTLLRDVSLRVVRHTLQIIAGEQLPMQSVNTLATFHSFGYVGILEQWVDDGMPAIEPAIDSLREAWSLCWNPTFLAGVSQKSTEALYRSRLSS